MSKMKFEQSNDVFRDLGLDRAEELAKRKAPVMAMTNDSLLHAKGLALSLAGHGLQLQCDAMLALIAEVERLQAELAAHKAALSRAARLTEGVVFIERV